MLKQVAAVLRAGGQDAEHLRDVLRPLARLPSASTGEELLAFFRSSPLVGLELEFDRDRDTGRAAGL